MNPDAINGDHVFLRNADEFLPLVIFVESMIDIPVDFDLLSVETHNQFVRP